MGAGNPQWIEKGWGEETKVFKLPVRVGDRVRELKDSGLDTDTILELLASEPPDRNSPAIDESALAEVGEMLRLALTLPPNKGGAIKKVIREVMERLRLSSMS